MATIIATSKINSGLSYDLSETSSLTAAAGTNVHSIDGVAISGRGSDQLVYVAGGVMGILGGIVMGDDALDQNARVVISASGFVQGGQDIASAAVKFFGQSASLLNRGIVIAAVGVDVVTGSEIPSQIVNQGKILGSSYGILRSGVFGIGPASLSLVNTGDITGAVASYDSTLGGRFVSDQLVNAGTMRGNVILGAGADIYRGLSGRVIGNIYGGDGDDVFTPGRFVDVIFGGDGIDTIDFGTSGAVRFYLDGNGASTGNALGDIYTGIENLVGSRIGNDFLRGDAGDNFIAGSGGVDQLEGVAGDDTLAGGAGRDTLTGGTGNDVFLLRAPTDVGDVINDFSIIAGNHDVIHLRGVFFGGLATGQMNSDIFRSAASNASGDTDDRFIFRTTDNTLWYDVDGTGRKAAVLLADFAVGVNLTIADFLII